jgi:hypothetical protein
MSPAVAWSQCMRSNEEVLAGGRHNDSVNDPHADRLTAPYRFRGMHRELEACRPLQSDETQLLSGLVMRGTTSWWHPPAFLRVTDRRLSVVIGHALSPDQVWDIPRRAIESVDLVLGPAVQVTYRSREGSERLTLRRSTRPVSVPGPLAMTTNDLFAALAAWAGGG